jgi:hypothetical protein
VEFSLRGKGKIPTEKEAIAIFLLWAEKDKLPPGMRIAWVRWQNPARRNVHLRNWRTATTPGEIEEARTSLRLGGWLRTARISVAEIRNNSPFGKPLPDSVRLRRKRKPSAKRGRVNARPKNAGAKTKKRRVSQNKKGMASSRKNKRKTKSR